MRLIKYIILLAITFIASVNYGFAQCAMCRVTVENNVNNGDTTVGAALNMGILYLFSAPYVLIAAIGFVWYRHARKKKKTITSYRRF